MESQRNTLEAWYSRFSNEGFEERPGDEFTAFAQDAKDNEVFERVKLTMPVLTGGGEKSFGPLQAVIMRNVATNVQEAVIGGSWHWLMEERPEETVALIRNFLDSPERAVTRQQGDR